MKAYGRYVPSLGQLDAYGAGSAGTAVILVKPFPKPARVGSYDRILLGAVPWFSPKNLGPDHGLFQFVVTTLQMTPDQKNVLLRVVLRDLSRTLTHGEATELRDAISAAVHEGAVSEWAARRGPVP